MLLAWLVTVTVTCAQAGKRKHGFLDFDQRGLAVLRMQSPDVSVQSGQLTNKAWICGDYAMVRLRIREQDKCVVSVLIAASHQQGAAFSALCRVLRESQKRTDLP